MGICSMCLSHSAVGRSVIFDVVFLGKTHLFTEYINPFKTNGLSYLYQKDEPISNFRGVGWYF